MAITDAAATDASFSLANMYLGNADNGEVVLAVNPMWAERFGMAFPDVEDLQSYLREHAYQPIDLWPAENARPVPVSTTHATSSRTSAATAPPPPAWSSGYEDTRCPRRR